MRRLTLPTVLLAMLLSLAAVDCEAGKQECKKQYEKDGKCYGVTRGAFRNRWWNFLERGMSYAEGGFLQEAEADLMKASAQRTNDQWRARTYGMHFVNYFPHRELGVVYYRQGRYEEAVFELETSLGMAESDKAKHFLKKALQGFLKQTGRDVAAPSVEITPVAGQIRGREVTVRGVARDDTYVAWVRVNGERFRQDRARAEVSFEMNVHLAEGENAIHVEVGDLVGNISEETLTLRADNRGPVISVEEILSQDGGAVSLRGAVYDETLKVASLEIDGRSIAVSPDGLIEFNERIPSPRDGVINVAVRDELGNETRALIMTKTAGVRGKSIVPTLWGRAVQVASASAEIPWIPQRDDVMEVAVSLKGLVDTAPPVVKLKDLVERQTVYEDEIFIEGSVLDDSTITRLRVNGEPILKREGRQVYFSTIVGLKVGLNEFEINAIDSFGNEATQRITIVREKQEVHKVGSRLSVAVLPLNHEGADLSPAGRAVYEQLVSALVQDGRFNVVERAELEAVLNEHKLVQSGLVDERSALKAGKLVAADAVMAGTVVESETALEVIVRMIDTETSEIMVDNDVFDEGRELASVGEIMKGLAWKFRRDVPLVQGLVVEAIDGGVLIDIGEGTRLKKNAKIIIYRETKKIVHPQTGRVLGVKTEQVGEAKVTEVFEDFSQAELRRGDSGGLRAMDMVITK